MGEQKASGRTVVEKSEREIVVTRVFDGPVRLVFDAWTKPDLFKLWWAPKSVPFSILACEMDVRTGGGYRLTFGGEGMEPMAFFGKYLEVVPDARLVWTNDEGDDGAVTTVTFEAVDGGTRVTLTELYPSKEALAEGAGAEDALPEQFEQLDALLASLRAAA